jgi:hypothetical protein
MSRAQINEARRRKWSEPAAPSTHEMQTRKKLRDAEAALPWLEDDADEHGEAMQPPLLAEAGEIIPDAPLAEAEDMNHSAETSLISMSPASTLSFGCAVSPVSSSRASTIPVSSPASTIPISLASTIPESLASTIAVSPVQPVNLFPCPIAQPPAAAASWWTRGWCTIS